MWNSDAGPDEMLAAKEAQRVPVSQNDLLPLLPNLMMVNPDRAHASRRSDIWGKICDVCKTASLFLSLLLGSYCFEVLSICLP